jgi:hypothetical protein
MKGRWVRLADAGGCALVREQLHVPDVPVVGFVVPGVRLVRDLVPVAAGHPHDGPRAVPRQVGEHDDVADLHGARLRRQQAPVPAPHLAPEVVQPSPGTPDPLEVLEIVVGADAPALAHAAAAELAPDERATRLVGAHRPASVARHPARLLSIASRQPHHRRPPRRPRPDSVASTAPTDALRLPHRVRVDRDLAVTDQLVQRLLRPTRSGRVGRRGTCPWPRSRRPSPRAGSRFGAPVSVWISCPVRPVSRSLASIRSVMPSPLGRSCRVGAGT